MAPNTDHTGPGDTAPPPAAAPSTTPKRNGCLTVLFVLGSIGIIALVIAIAVGVPMFKKYTLRAKTAEAHWMLTELTHASCAWYGENGQFPPSAPLHPVDTPARHEPVETTDWSEHATWAALSFATEEPHYFQYQYDSSGTGAGAQFTASAFADLDGDGVFSTFQRFGGVGDEGCAPDPAGLHINNELE